MSVTTLSGVYLQEWKGSRESSKMRIGMLQTDRCTADDFRRLFASSREEFQRLSYTLTGNLDLAAQSYDLALQESLRSATLVFREWMVRWARRLIVKACVVEMYSDIQRAARNISLGRETRGTGQCGALPRTLTVTPEVLEVKIVALDALSRFVVVLRVIEGYSRRETALLLRVDEAICDAAHELASFSMSFRHDSPRMEGAATTA
jgi:hypothetical protein